VINKIAYRTLRLLSPEQAHTVAKWAMKYKILAPGPVYMQNTETTMRHRLFGEELNNPLGIAAGFDKNAELIDVVQSYGFGFIEIGSITYLGGPGNPKPRLFRYENDRLLNRMGLNGIPASDVAIRLNNVRSKVYGVNIAKTHSPDIMGDKAVRDICDSYNLLKHYGLYTVINISCPNTREGRTFEDPDALKELLSAIAAIKGQKPLLVKLSPVSIKNHERFDKIIGICELAGIDGYVASNTIPHEDTKLGKGGLSGPDIRPYTLEIINSIHRNIRKPIIAVGGITSYVDILAYMQAGATACQVYCGFVCGHTAGPRFAHNILHDGVIYG
jgi:dihydroorotate dehydrogenase